ncbi:zinc-binding dehydrogenase [Solimonas terrae]|uniref:Zinc-binding dehydrogenase n=1 Tax=Solimonas terrae TaxID=1396819 RepID=A0A6M2BWW9_9GAMM|nr:zinc-binding dehydrogenase [Solimonas terrae]NGY06998.1 zinc-binding dehydrogenase [Solimonas terrae]
MFAVYAEAPNFNDPLSAVVVGERPAPSPRVGWVRVKLEAASLNWHDLWTLRGLGGMNGRPEAFPMILGSDGAGTLDDGTPVALYPLMGDPDWRGDETLDPRRTVLAEEVQGTFADFVAVPTRNAVPLPAGIARDTAAILGATWLTAYRMLFTKARVRPGQTVLVQGASGGVATALIQLGHAAGLRVWATGRGATKRELALRLGAQRCFESGESLPAPVDAVFDLVGTATFAHSIKHVKAGGVVVVAGGASGLEATLDLARVFIEQITIVGSFDGTLHEFLELLDFVAQAGIKPHVGHVLLMTDAVEGLRRMLAGETMGKIVLTRRQADS